MPPTLTAFWLVIHTTTFHMVDGSSIEVQSVRAMEHRSEIQCVMAARDLANRHSTERNKIVIAVCTPQQPSWWIVRGQS